MKLTKYFQAFFNSSQSSGFLLLFCVGISLLVANSSLGTGFRDLLETVVGPYSISVWINDGLMAIFFLLVGLEIKREMIEGELSSLQNAMLPIFAAVGGMLVPAGLYFVFNHDTPYRDGWGIPMATDIAFSLALVSMLGRKVPPALKIFLAALAIVDDLGAILVIAIFYTDEIHWVYLYISLGIMLLLMLFNFLKLKRHIYYLLPGIALWYCMHHSGIHATIAGVLLAFTVPTNLSDVETSPLEKLEHQLSMPVNFIIMPLFALANTNIALKAGMVDGLFTPLGLGILAGLIFGKFAGITLFSWLATKLKLAVLPERCNWMHMSGAGFLAGIGFTMSIFIALLSFKTDIAVQEEAKFAILCASGMAGFIGYSILKYLARRKPSRTVA